MEFKSSVFISCVKPVMTYATETKADKVTEKKTISNNCNEKF